jgi:hypothetical protein
LEIPPGQFSLPDFGRATPLRDESRCPTIETALEMNFGGFEMLSCLYIKAPEVAKALECGGG